MMKKKTQPVSPSPRTGSCLSKVLLALALLALAACNREKPGLLSEPAAQNEGTAYPLAIKNYAPSEQYGEPWSGKTQIFENAPSRAVVTTQTVAELLLHLDLADRIAGVCGVFDAVEEGLEAEFAKLNIITESYASKELVIGANPDIVIGRGGLFANADWGCGTVEDLNDMGIKTFALNASRPDADINDLYRDIEELGAIFDVRENAAAMIRETQTKFAAVKEKLADESPKTYGWVWSIDNGAIAIYSANSENFINGALEQIKLVNAFANVSGDVGMEQIVASNPDILISVDPSLTGDVLEALYSIKALENVNAIKNRQLYIVDYNELWGYGYQTFRGMEKLAAEVFGG
ncbi:MAG: ABC transporter substrate-binding protein [Spirochaetaceae bacterium]|nr:ABC transporter substrate-binding protein [Spirochaetaceae bacterium]